MRTRKQKQTKSKKNVSARRAKKPDLKQSRLLAGLVVLDQRLKIFYFIPHAPQNLEETSPFGWYTPGLHASSNMILSATILPADVREPFSGPEHVLHFRLRRLLWRNVIPIDITALQQIAQIGVESLFRVVQTNDAELARAVDSLKFADGVPFLHVSSVEGQGHLSDSEFDLDRLLEFVESVFTHLSGTSEWRPFVNATKDAMQAANRQLPRSLDLCQSFHNVTTPNELALMSFGWRLGKDDPLVPIAVTNVQGDPQKYIDRICLTADMVSSERKKLMANLPAELLDNVYLISVPSVHWSHYREWRGQGDELTANDRKAFMAAYKNAVQQSTYFDSFDGVTDPHLLENKLFQMVMHMRAADHRCYTAGLSLLSSATLTPVLRLEPKVNQVRGQLKILAHCARSNARIRSQYKLSRLARVVGQRMHDLVDQKFLIRIDQPTTESRIQGLKVVSDVPLEWMPCGGLPLGLRYDLSRIPVLPGNLFLIHCMMPPVIIDVETLFDILVIRSFNADDPLSTLLEQAINHALKESGNARNKIRFVDVETEEDLVNALSTFSGAILVFDGHGSYEDRFGIGTFVVGGKPVDVWRLKYRCQFPPIVIFSACDTHPLDGSHSSCANAAFTLGARTVLATSLPINGGLAAMFIGRLMLRIFEFVPIALKHREILTWREVISGLLRMSYTSEVTRLLIRHEQLSITDAARDHVQFAANTAINNRQGDWFETYLKALARASSTHVNDVREMVLRWAPLTDAHKYLQLGSPENVVITSGRE